jgi:hypothetical protein
MQVSAEGWMHPPVFVSRSRWMYLVRRKKATNPEAENQGSACSTKKSAGCRLLLTWRTLRATRNASHTMTSTEGPTLSPSGALT